MIERIYEESHGFLIEDETFHMHIYHMCKENNLSAPTSS